MGEEDGRSPTGEPQTSVLLQREAVRVASASRAGASPSAVEATLASISAEVTAEAIERLNRNAIPKGPKPQGGR